MALIVILAGIGLTMYGNSVTRAKEATLKEDLFRMRDAIDQYYADKNKYPPTLEALVTRQVSAGGAGRSVHATRRHLADDDVGARARQSVGRARHLRREERLGATGSTARPTQTGDDDAKRTFDSNAPAGWCRCVGACPAGGHRVRQGAADGAHRARTVTRDVRPTRCCRPAASPRSRAFVAEAGGTPVQNGTTVRFTTNLGRVDPVEAQTRNGMAIDDVHRRRRVRRRRRPGDVRKHRGGTTAAGNDHAGQRRADPRRRGGGGRRRRCAPTPVRAVHGRHRRAHRDRHSAPAAASLPGSPGDLQHDGRPAERDQRHHRRQRRGAGPRLTTDPTPHGDGDSRHQGQQRRRHRSPAKPPPDSDGHARGTAATAAAGVGQSVDVHRDVAVTDGETTDGQARSYQWDFGDDIVGDDQRQHASTHVYTTTVGASGPSRCEVTFVQRPDRVGVDRDHHRGPSVRQMSAASRRSIVLPGALAGERGYAMAALLVGMSVMAVVMTVAMPVWSTAGQARERRRAGVPRRAVRPRHRALPAQVRQRAAAQHRRPGQRDASCARSISTR